MIYTNTIIVTPNKCNKNIQSINKDGLIYYLPVDLEDRLEESVQHIYEENINILNINITPITAEFSNDLLHLVVIVRYIITYIYSA